MPLRCHETPTRQTDPEATEANPSDTESQTAVCHSPAVRREADCRNRGLLGLANLPLPEKHEATQPKIDRPSLPAPSSVERLLCRDDNGRPRGRHYYGPGLSQAYER